MLMPFLAIKNSDRKVNEIIFNLVYTFPYWLDGYITIIDDANFVLLVANMTKIILLLKLNYMKLLNLTDCAY